MKSGLKFAMLLLVCLMLIDASADDISYYYTAS